jgi:hypothetical protein
VSLRVGVDFLADFAGDLLPKYLLHVFILVYDGLFGVDPELETGEVDVLKRAFAVTRVHNGVIGFQRVVVAVPAHLLPFVFDGGRLHFVVGMFFLTILLESVVPSERNGFDSE